MEAQTYKILPDKVEYYVTEILVRHGVSSEHAEETAYVLVKADMSGVFSHGLNTLESLVIEPIKTRNLNPNAELIEEVNAEIKTVKALDAQLGLGHHAGMCAVDYVKELARDYGCAKVYVYNANHFGAAGVYAREIACDGDLIGEVKCTTPHIVIPYEGLYKAVGTNPIAIAIPYNKNGDTVDLDMATSIHAASAIFKALIEHAEKLPFLVIGPDGPTTDPRVFNYSVDEFLRTGGLPPLGFSDNVGYKGSDLAMMIEFMGVLCRGVSGYRSPIFEERKGGVEHIFYAERIDFRYSLQEVHKNISYTMADFKRRAGGNVKLPGEIEAKNREISMTEGIPYTAKSIDRLNRLGAEVGIEEIVALSR